MEKNIWFLYYYDSEIDVLAVCDTFEQANAEMKDDYESFLESVFR